MKEFAVIFIYSSAAGFWILLIAMGLDGIYNKGIRAGKRERLRKSKS